MVCEAPSIYPVCYGNEEEGTYRLLGVGRYGDNLQAIDDPIHAIEEFQDSERGLVRCGEYDSYGRRIYEDGNSIEVATAECDTIIGTAARIRDNERIRLGIGVNLLRSTKQANALVANRRVKDTFGTTIGCHDSFGYNDFAGMEIGDHDVDLKETGRDMLIGHLVTCSFVTGAGNFSNGRLLFAQKIQRIDDIKSRVTGSTLYWVHSSSGTSRVEVRSNDINISDWATRVRIGSTAIALAIGQTKFATRLKNLDTHSEDAVQAAAKRYNTAPINPDGTFRESTNLEKAIAFQLNMAETFLSDGMAEYGPRPAELVWTAQELKQYCLDMRKVMAGEAPLSLIADRADWAAKTQVILQRIARDRSEDKPRRLGDKKCEQHDVSYDFLHISRNDKGKITAKRSGFGYKLRDEKRAFKATIPHRTVQRASHTPPKRTRAALRAELIKTWMLSSCKWEYLWFESKKIGEYPIQVWTRNARQTQLPRQDVLALRRNGIKR